MIKLRVNELAGEFGITSEELMTMLRSMDVPVRSHLSQLSDEQIARLRARWEREKRARQEKPAAAPARRRRGTAAAAAAAPVVAAPVPEAAPEAAGTAPARRRRKASDIAAAAEVTAAHEAEVAATAATNIEPAVSRLEEELLVADPAPEAPPRQPIEESRITAYSSPPTPARPSAPRPPEANTYSRSGDATTAGPAQTPRPASGGDWQRPRPVVPGPPRPKPASAGGYPPRPIASAAPGGASGSSSASGLAPRRDDKRGGAGKRKKGKRGSVDQEAVTANISKTMTAMRGAPARRGSRRSDEPSYREEVEAQRIAEVEREKTIVRVNEFITVSELGAILKVPPTQIVTFTLKNLGLMVTINQRLDFDQIELIASEFGFQAVREADYAVADSADEVEDERADLISRPPVVTIMGHVDHGKTSLLDYIRKANVVAGEAGGITQHIGAYHVTLANGKTITFLDTPGHEAFTAMRARGAQVTDIVVLVVAADDQVMPQTIEAISHAKNAGVPMVIAINKIDLPSANVPKVKQELLQHGVVLEEFGGTVLDTPISAKKGTGVPELLEQILLQAEILDLRANPNRRASGVVVEAQLDPGKGPVATVLIENGTIRVGEDFICGMFSGRVRNLFDERGKPVKSAGPAIPVQVLGMDGVPMAGDQLRVVEDATSSREIAQRRQRLDREAKSRRTSRAAVSLEDFMSQAAAGLVQSLRLVIKADQGGPAEALADSLGQLSTSEVRVEIIHRGVGAITESDIQLAKASGAIIIGFHVRPDNNARAAAERDGVEIKLYRIIYEAVAEVRAALEGLLRPDEKEVVLGEAEVRELFKVPRIGVIAGCNVRSGVINRAGKVRVVRDGVEIYGGTIGSLRRFKDDVKEVREGFECGIGIENFNDLKVGDVIECYRTDQIARTL
ncbi:MAG: translation initiation factor IF-2 [Gemmatimonadaceae bacterium]|nr:translation initiation factor IF-2 [Gemmatimonadaceae bacterium]